MRGNGHRVDEYAGVAPGAVQAMRALETYVGQSGIERSLLHQSPTGRCQMTCTISRAGSLPGVLVDLTLAVVAINGWNRLAVAFRVSPRE